MATDLIKADENVSEKKKVTYRRLGGDIYHSGNQNTTQRHLQRALSERYRSWAELTIRNLFNWFDRWRLPSIIPGVFKISVAAIETERLTVEETYTEREREARNPFRYLIDATLIDALVGHPESSIDCTILLVNLLSTDSKHWLASTGSLSSTFNFNSNSFNIIPFSMDFLRFFAIFMRFLGFLGISDGFLGILGIFDGFFGNFWKFSGIYRNCFWDTWIFSMDFLGFLGISDGFLWDFWDF